MNRTKGWIDVMKDKKGRKLLPVLEDMRLRDNAVLICSFGEDDPNVPISEHMAEYHSAQIAVGLELLAEAAGCHEVMLYAASLDVSILAEKLSDELNVTVKIGPASPVLREPTALYSVIDTGDVRVGNAEEEYCRTYLSYGYGGRPTLVVDAETVFQAYRLSEWLGTTKHIAFIGNETDIREVDTGVPLVSLINDAAEAEHILLGGLCGRYLSPEEVGETVIEYTYLFDSVKVLKSKDCVVDELAVLYSTAKELSCQKCVLCREGTWQLKTILNDITEGKANRDDIALIEDITPLISAGALCAFGKNMILPAMTAFALYRQELTDHIVGKNCKAGKCRGLLSYLIDPALCAGCGECLDSCPEEAIDGEDGFIHMIDDKLCIKCGKCVPVCPEAAIKCGEKFKVPKKLVKVGKFH